MHKSISYFEEKYNPTNREIIWLGRWAVNWFDCETHPGRGEAVKVSRWASAGWPSQLWRPVPLYWKTTKRYNPIRFSVVIAKLAWSFWYFVDCKFWIAFTHSSLQFKVWDNQNVSKFQALGQTFYNNLFRENPVLRNQFNMSNQRTNSQAGTYKDMTCWFDWLKTKNHPKPI